MPIAENFPLGGLGDQLQDILRRLKALEARSRVLQNGSLVVQDINGNNRAVYGQLSDGTYGLQVFDNTHAERVRIGQLASGDYGIQVTDTAGNTEEILPQVAQYVSTGIVVTSQTYIQNGGPAVTAVVGASGKVGVDSSAFVAANAANVGAWVALFVDGAHNTDLTEVDSAAGQITVSFGSTIILTGLSAGSHTFELYYKWTSASGTANFSNRSLVVTPL